MRMRVEHFGTWAYALRMAVLACLFATSDGIGSNLQGYWKWWTSSGCISSWREKLGLEPYWSDNASVHFSSPEEIANIDCECSATRAGPLRPGHVHLTGNHINNTFFPADSPAEMGWRCETDNTIEGSYWGGAATFVPVDCGAGEIYDHASKQCVSAVDVDNGVGSCPTPLVGNPMHVGTGNKFQVEHDYIDGLGRLHFSRYFNSSERAVLRYEPNALGKRWRSSYSQRLVLYVDANPPQVLAVRPDGKRIAFTRPVSDWVPTVAGIYGKLTETPTGFMLVTEEGGHIELYSADGKLESLRDSSFGEATMQYDPAGRLTSVSDAIGRTLIFQYDNANRVISLSAPDGAVYRYDYDQLGRLTAVRFPDDTPNSEDDNPQRRYHYEDGRHPAALTGITDERGTRAATWAYDDIGRAISSEHAGGASRYMINFNVDGTTSVTDPLGLHQQYLLSTQGGRTVITETARHACPGCSAGSLSYTYDANGHLIAEQGFTNVEITYERDGEGLVVRQTDAAGTAEARSVATEWDPVWHRPVTVSESQRVTIMRYDEDGRLTARTIRSTAP